MLIIAPVHAYAKGLDWQDACVRDATVAKLGRICSQTHGLLKQIQRLHAQAKYLVCMLPETFINFTGITANWEKQYKTHYPVH